MVIRYSDSEILTNTDISPKIIEILNEAEEYCFIVSPYLKTWEQFEKYLEIACKQKKRIVFLLRDDQTKEKKIIDFYEKHKFDIFFIENLHAKIYLNEKQALISSMNLYDASQRRNYEIGNLINDSKIVYEITDKIILNEMVKYWTKDVWEGEYCELLKNDLFFEKEIRYCVNCSKPIKNIYKIHFCNECIVKSKTENDYVLNGIYCHKCGQKENNITNKTPYCYKCWRKDYDKRNGA